MKKLRVGIIGTGGIAHSHMKTYLKQPDVEIVAGCDLIEGKAEKFFESFGVSGVKCYQSHTEMLADKSLELDVVSVCTYNCTHAQCTIAALEAGINVILEKPMCVTTEQAVEIIRAEKKSGKLLSVGFQPRFEPNMQMIKRIVDSGELGDIYYIQTGGGRRCGIPVGFTKDGDIIDSFIKKDTAALGAIGDIGCYSLDMVLNAIGYPKPLTVTGYKSNFFGTDPLYYKGVDKPEFFADKFEVDDFAAAFIRLEGGIILDFRIAWAMHLDTPGDTIIMGKKGSLRIPSTGCWNGAPGGAMTLYHNIAGKPTESIIPLIEYEEDTYDKIWQGKIRSFLDAVVSGAKSPIPSEQILINQLIIDSIVKSAELGEEIKVEMPEI